MHFDGVDWTTTFVGAQFLDDVWSSGPTDVIAVGQGGTILRYQP